MVKCLRRVRRWLSLGHRQPTLVDVWASLLLTEPPCEGTISDMVSLDMQVQDLSQELQWI